LSKEDRDSHTPGKCGDFEEKHQFYILDKKTCSKTYEEPTITPITRNAASQDDKFVNQGF